MLSDSQAYQGTKMAQFSTAITGKVSEGSNMIFGYLNLRTTNRILVEENALLRKQIEQSYTSFDRRQFYVNDTVYRQVYNYVGADVVRNSIMRSNNYLWINKGRKQGIEPDMAVISTDGIVGIVKIVSDDYASILSVLHSESRISANIQRTNTSGTLVWQGHSFRYGNIIDIPSNFDIKIGDTVTTSNYSISFPRGILIGFVTKIELDKNQSFYEIEIEFSTNFNALKHVYVVQNFDKQEHDQLLKLQTDSDE
ncbi:rod shape-determining protein MreC [Bacteroidia bacterium]|nr:rod shape-determining protein MreC [Bacteroidia bacterium]